MAKYVKAMLADLSAPSLNATMPQADTSTNIIKAYEAIERACIDTQA